MPIPTGCGISCDMRININAYRKNFSFVLLFIFLFGHGQHQTRNAREEKSPSSPYSFLIVPFMPKLYNSQIDYLLNKTSGKTSRQLAEYFRDEINHHLYSELKKRKYFSVDLMSDTVKYKKELSSIYRNTYLEYMPVPDQEHYSPPVKEPKQKGIKDGQIVVDAEVKDRFMNAKISDARLVPALFQRFKTRYFIFINQLDLFSSPYKDGEIHSVEETNKKRLVIHYTVYSLNAEEINSGIAETIMDEEEYSPEKISKKYLRSLCGIIVSRIEKRIQAGSSK
jgi:hypothetical protein